MNAPTAVLTTNDQTTLVEGQSQAQTAVELLLRGRIQGLGVRPAIARLAKQMQLTGWAANSSAGVVIHLEGKAAAIASFQGLLPSQLPSLADFSVECTDTISPVGCTDFEIRIASDGGILDVDVPVDLGLCRECAGELVDRADRRFGYAFSSCTHCGPRYSIIGSMPYERHSTSMAPFAMCALCRSEYSDSEDRRFHAQTVTCETCGPRVSFESPESSEPISGSPAIDAAAAVIGFGGIIAMKGLGGYQLICDATNTKAVQRLRDNKQRRSKPFAIMISSCDDLCGPLTNAEKRTLTSPANPIVVLDHATVPHLAPNIHPGMNSPGVFLPTTPLHLLLLNELKRPLVVTSGNLDSEPLVFEDDRARTAIRALADGWLRHDRPILRPIDDSVVRVIAGNPVTIRAGRGQAPLRLVVPTSRAIIAVGADQKVACAMSNGRQVVLGPHIGNMSTVAARRRFVEQIADLQKLYGVEADVIAHDLHPDYFTTRWSADQNKRTIAIQHHHAHVVSGMVEHSLLEQQVLGVAFDGTGFGTDGTVWGGEFLLASKTDFRRVASLLTFVLPGGEAAIREPWRVAVSLLEAAIPGITAEEIAALLTDGRKRLCARESAPNTQPSLNQIRQILTLIRSRIGVVTSSMGRLFDGIASIVLGISSSDFEGEPAMRLESQCDKANIGDGYPIELISADSLIVIDWRPIVRAIVADMQMGCDRSTIAMRFHQTIANAVGMVAARFPAEPVVLSGGCFQNRILTELATNQLRQQSRLVLSPQRIPPNDGGLAAGQIAIAAARLEIEDRKRTSPCV